VWLSNASEQGTSTEAPIPCNARAPINKIRLGAAPHAIEARTKRIKRIALAETWVGAVWPAAAIATAETETSAGETGRRRHYVAGMSNSHPSIAEIAALIGNPARANMLAALLDGRALTAGELAFAARVSPQTTSGHLGKLTEAGLLALHRQGRHAYYRLASPLIGRMIESMMAVAAEGPPRYRPRWRGDEALRTARTCYDHLAGRLGVALADALAAREHIVLGEDGGVVTAAGEAFFTGFGIAIAEIGRGKRAFCRPCLDWSERRPHLAGAVGAALATQCFSLGWLRRERDTRAVTITKPGLRGFAAQFGVQLDTSADQLSCSVPD
jgi:DNA-binding transcriptional ArsR family regulator